MDAGLGARAASEQPEVPDLAAKGHLRAMGKSDQVTRASDVLESRRGDSIGVERDVVLADLETVPDHIVSWREIDRCLGAGGIQTSLNRNGIVLVVVRNGILRG